MTTEIFIHDVGAGHAVHAITPDGKVIVIDLGCSPDFSPLEWLKKKTGTAIIDLLVITHPHGDHLDEVLKLDGLGMQVRQLSRPTWLTEAEIRAANQIDYTKHVDKYLEMNAKYVHGVRPEEKIVDNPAGTGGASIKLFWSQDCGHSQINNHSAVVSLSYATSTVIIPGDNEAPSWRVLLGQPDFVTTLKAANIFMASHHGRESGYCADVFADDRKPNLFVISDGVVRDTDAAPSYSQQARGWRVHARDGTESRGKNVVTTRANGMVEIKLGYTAPDKPYRAVTVDTFAPSAG